MPPQLRNNRYGKSNVRLVKVTRDGREHRLKELTVQLLLAGDFEATYLTGDNSTVLPTDTIKNSIYVLAKEDPIQTIEEFGLVLSQYFQERLAHVTTVEVEIAERHWQRATVGGQPHTHTFTGTDTEQARCRITHGSAGTTDTIDIQSSIQNLVLLKTTGSGFSNFLQDEFTTLAATDDRLLGTTLHAHWHYRDTTVDFDQTRARVRELLIEHFATHESHSLQNTLYVMGSAVLAALPALADLHLVMPNQHNLLVDLSPFGLENQNEIFVPIDEPFGTIEGYLQAS